MPPRMGAAFFRSVALPFNFAERHFVREDFSGKFVPLLEHNGVGIDLENGMEFPADERGGTGFEAFSLERIGCVFNPHGDIVPLDFGYGHPIAVIRPGKSYGQLFSIKRIFTVFDRKRYQPSFDFDDFRRDPAGRNGIAELRQSLPLRREFRIGHDRYERIPVFGRRNGFFIRIFKKALCHDDFGKSRSVSFARSYGNGFRFPYGHSDDRFFESNRHSSGAKLDEKGRVRSFGIVLRRFGGHV